MPPNTQQSEKKGWQQAYATAVKRAEEKVMVYRKTRDHAHDAEFRRVIERVRLVLSEGNLPSAEDLNVVYYLVGDWPVGHAPRHIRAQFET
ncbi:hypothetical protein GCM10008949_53520 [Deinococcus humi]|nr:hypothetical protein GCM10008949_53520 [Deinococcus humi]